MSKSGSPEAAFIGKITASATHEIRNVLAIVKESAGLIDDLMQASVTRGPLDGDRVFKATQRIDAQVARGTELIAGLNRFAHSMDHDRQSVDLCEEVRHVVFLSQRFARKKMQTVVAEPSGGMPGFTASSLAVQMALFAGVELLMEELPEGATIEMRECGARGMPAVEMWGEANEATIPIPPAGEAWDRTREMVQDLGAALEATEAKGGLLLVFGSEG